MVSATGLTAADGGAAQEPPSLVFPRTPKNEGEMIGKEFSDEARHQWFADKEAKRDAVLKALVTETDPKIQRKLRASARRYKAMIAMGPERTRAASSHPQYAQRYPLGEIKQRD